MNRQDERTLDISHALRQDLLQDLGVLQLLLDLGNDGIRQLLLLALLDLALVTDPRVQDGLGLGSQGGLLLQLICLSLEPRGFLGHVVRSCVVRRDACAEWRACAPGAGDSAASHTLETSNRLLVTSTTPSICLTFSMRSLTAWVWSERAAFRMPAIFLL